MSNGRVVDNFAIIFLNTIRYLVFKDLNIENCLRVAVVCT